MSGDEGITPLSEVFRLVVENAPIASLPFRLVEIGGSTEVHLLVMRRHEAQVHAYAQLAGIPREEAAVQVQQAAERLSEAWGQALFGWNTYCVRAAGDHAQTYGNVAVDHPGWLDDYTAAAMLSHEEAALRISHAHIAICRH